jgi:hypothetical protein
MRYSIDILRPFAHCALIKTQLSRNLCFYRLTAGSRRNVDSDNLGIPGEIKSVQPGEIISGIVGDIERNQQVPKNSNFSLTDPQFNLRLPRMHQPAKFSEPGGSSRSFNSFASELSTRKYLAFLTYRNNAPERKVQPVDEFKELRSWVARNQPGSMT